MQRPVLKSTQITNEKFADVTYHIEGGLTPVLTVEMDQAQTLFFEHHVMLWKSTDLATSASRLSGGFKRIIAGMPIILLQATGHGQIAFSRNGPGQIYPIHLEPGDEIDVREHQYLAATSNLEYTFSRVKGVVNSLFGGSGFFIDKFKANNDSGIVWLHAFGNTFEKVLLEGEQIDVETGSWVYKDPTVQMETRVQSSLATGLLGSGNGSIVCNRFTGPGRVGIQSCSMTLDQDDAGDTSSAVTGGLVGSLLSGLLRK